MSEKTHEIAKKQFDVAKVQHFNLYAVDENDQTAAHYAVAGGSDKALALLIELDAKSKVVHSF